MTKEKFELVKICIQKQESWRPENAGRYIATVDYSGPKGALTMPLGPDVSERLLAVLGPMIAKLGADAANEIATDVLNAIEEANNPAITIGQEVPPV